MSKNLVNWCMKNICFHFCFSDNFKQSCHGSGPDILDSNQLLFYAGNATSFAPDSLGKLMSILNKKKSECGDDHGKWMHELWSFIEDVYYLSNSLSGTSVSYIGREYFKQKMNAINKLGVINDVQCRDVEGNVEKCLAYSTEIREHAKNLPNYKKISQDLCSKELQTQYTEIIAEITNFSIALNANEIETKILELIKLKKLKYKETRASVDYFGSKVPTLLEIYSCTYDAWYKLNDVYTGYHNFGGKSASEKQKKEHAVKTFDGFMSEFDKCIKTIDANGPQKVKSELTEASKEIGGSIQIIYDLTFDLPTKILEIINGKKAGKEEAKSAKKQKGGADKGADKGAGKGAAKDAKGGKGGKK